MMHATQCMLMETICLLKLMNREVHSVRFAIDLRLGPWCGNGFVRASGAFSGNTLRYICKDTDEKACNGL